MTNIPVLLSLASKFNLRVHQMDVTTEILNSIMEEAVYLNPPGYDHLVPPGYSLKLRKYLYFLKKSPRVWNGLDTILFYRRFLG